MKNLIPKLNKGYCMKKTSAIILLLLLVSALSNLNAQNFSRVIQMQNRRMNGPDITRLQQRLLSLGFRKTGAADGWYGPLTEGSVKAVQYYMGFSQDGRVTKAFWDMLFDSKQDGLLKNISLIAGDAPGASIVTVKRNGPNNDFDEFVIQTLNNEVKTVMFRHINEGIIIFRFKLWYLGDAVFIIQDVYYGDYGTHVYHKTAGGFFELKNGFQNPADPAMEGIINRANDGIKSAGFTVPPLIPASLPAASEKQSANPTQPVQPAAEANQSIPVNPPANSAESQSAPGNPGNPAAEPQEKP